MGTLGTARQDDAQYPRLSIWVAVGPGQQDSALRYFVTGCAGFIGSALTDRLLARGHQVVGYDNFSTGRKNFLDRARRSASFRLIEGDTLDARTLAASMAGSEIVCHCAANADVRFGLERPRRDLEQNTIATHNVLEAMRSSGVQRIAFCSTGSVYGESALLPTPEDAPFPVQTSLYGASKLAGEGLIAAYCTGFGFQGYIFRMVSILGERYTHGHVVDFYRQLRIDASRLRVLGDGGQRKSYLYVEDCIDAMLLAIERAEGRINILNLGHDDYCELRDSIGWICAELGVAPAIEYAGGERGWAGDNPFIWLDARRMRALGWQPTLSLRESVLRTLSYLRSHADWPEPRPA
jgi:UDP-glucose 4-epimerase